MEEIMKRFICLTLAVLILAVSSPALAAGDHHFRQKLNSFISTALKKNPELMEARNRIKVAREVPSQAGSLDDPMMKFELMNLPVDTFSFTQEAMTQKHLTLSQKFPYPGKLGLRTKMADKNVKITEESYDDLKLKITRQVKQSYYELCFILAAIDITRQNKTLLEQFVTIAETKYSVGKGIQQDVLKAQVELSKIMDELIELNKHKESEQARLNTLMYRLPQEPITIPHGITKTPFNFSIEELQRMAEQHRPVLNEIMALKERYQIARQLAKKEYYPDFDIGFRWGSREDSPVQEHPDFVSAFVGINIPLWHKTKQSRKVAEESYKVEMAKETYNKAKNAIFLRIKELMDEEARGDKTLQLIEKGILPQARQSLESAMAGYGVDKVDFLTLLDNQVTLLKWETKYHRELTDYEKNLAEVEHVVGKSLF